MSPFPYGARWDPVEARLEVSGRGGGEGLDSCDPGCGIGSEWGSTQILLSPCLPEPLLGATHEYPKVKAGR